MTVVWDVASCSLVDVYQVSDVFSPSITGAILLIVLKKEALCISETSVNFCRTTMCNILEDSDLHTRSHDNLNSFCGIENIYFT
jgi:hypothetical protein